MRDVIRKGVTEENLLNSVTMIFNEGWTSVKLYFMIGLPTETEQDVAAIAQLAHKVLDKYYELDKSKRKKSPRISVSTSTFVPKPFTPFQWEAQDSIETTYEKQKIVRSNIHSKAISYSWHDADTSFLEGVFARGDRKLNKVLLRAHELGCKFEFSVTVVASYTTFIAEPPTIYISPSAAEEGRDALSETLPLYWTAFSSLSFKAFVESLVDKPFPSSLSTLFSTLAFKASNSAVDGTRPAAAFAFAHASFACTIREVKTGVRSSAAISVSSYTPQALPFLLM